MRALLAVALLIGANPSPAEERDQVIAMLTDQIRTMSDGHLKGVHIVELAHWHFERAGDVRAANPAASDQSMETVVELLEFALKKYPRAGTDSAYFELAGAYTALGRAEPAATTLESLVTKFPESRLVPDACLALAHLLAKTDTAKSRRYLESVLP